ncbi:MAG: hypothetical protein ACOCWR_06410 [Oceanidesulfovibrio sp.]
MWHDSEGIVHIKDKEPTDKEEKQFAEELDQPNPDPAARVTAQPAPAPKDGTEPAETADPSAQQTAPPKASPDQPQPSETQEAMDQPTRRQPDSGQVVQPMPQRQPQIPEFPQNIGEFTPEMQRQMQEQLQQQMQDMGPSMLMGVIGAALIPGLVIGLIGYLISIYVLYRIGRKFGVGTFPKWLIPLYNLILLTRCAGLSPWWAAPTIASFGLAILLIPLMFVDLMFAMSLMTLAQILNFIGYIVMAVIIGKIAERLGKNLILWVIMALIPIVNLVAVLILAFDSSRPAMAGAAPSPEDEFAAPRMRRPGKSRSSDEPPLLSAPPSPPKKKNPLDEDDGFHRPGAPPLKH